MLSLGRNFLLTLPPVKFLLLATVLGQLLGDSREALGQRVDNEVSGCKHCLGGGSGLVPGSEHVALSRPQRTVPQRQLASLASSQSLVQVYCLCVPAHNRKSQNVGKVMQSQDEKLKCCIFLIDM